MDPVYVKVGDRLAFVPSAGGGALELGCNADGSLWVAPTEGAAAAFVATTTAEGGIQVSTASATVSTLTVASEVRAAAFTTTSDGRRKVVQPEPVPGLAAIDRLRPVTYVWADGRPTLRSGVAEVGLLAQDVDAVLPQLVMRDAAGHLGVAYERLAPVLIAAVQELDAAVSAGGAAVAALQSTMAGLAPAPAPALAPNPM